MLRHRLGVVGVLLAAAPGLKRRLGEERGASVVEFALGAGVFFTLVVMIAEAALLFHGWIAVTHAARESARSGALCYNRSVQACTASQIATWANNAIVGVDPAAVDAPQVSVVTQSLGGENVKWLQVSLTYHVPIVDPLAGKFFPGGLTLPAVSAMRLENQ